MKRFAPLAAATLLLAACGTEAEDGTSCTVVALEEGGQQIRCEDGTVAEIADGANGVDGDSCTVVAEPDGVTKTITCEDGTTVTVRDGKPGDKGDPGDPGDPGTSCGVEDNGDGTYTINCEDGTTVTVRDGANGVDGVDGTSCTVEDRGDGTARVSCPDGTSVIIPLAGAVCLGDFRAGAFDIGGPWRPSGGAIVDETTPGHDGPGIGYIPSTPLCSGTGAIAQPTVCVGSAAERGPLVLSVHHRNTGDGAVAGLGYGSAGTVSLGPSGATWTESRICLGEAGYGDEVAFRFVAAELPASCASGTVGRLEFDDVAIEAAERNECPEVGEVLNGDFEEGDGGWSVAGTGVAQIVDEGWSTVGRLSATGCEEPALVGKLSIPLATNFPHAALQVRASGTSGTTLRVNVETDSPYGVEFTGTGAVETKRICLSDGFGVVAPLSLVAEAPASCSTAGARTWTVDDLRVVFDADCP